MIASEYYLTITLLLMSFIIACKPAYSSHEVEQQTAAIKTLPTFHFTQPLPQAMRQQFDKQDTTLSHTAIQSIQLTATLVGDHRAQAIVVNRQGKQVTLRPRDYVGENRWQVQQISSKQVKLSQSSGRHYVLQLS